MDFVWLAVVVLFFLVSGLLLRGMCFLKTEN